MRCQEVREILSGVMDGREEARETLVMEHVEGCSECHEWRESMQMALESLEAATVAIPAVDLSHAIMARLPARHPASYRVAPSLPLKKLALLMGACWLLGAMMMGVGIGVWGRYSGGSPHAVAASAKASAGAAGSVAGSAWSACGVLIPLAVSAIARTFAVRSHEILGFLIVDTVVLLLAVVIWRRRRSFAGPFCMIP